MVAQCPHFTRERPNRRVVLSDALNVPSGTSRTQLSNTTNEPARDRSETVRTVQREPLPERKFNPIQYRFRTMAAFH